MRNTILLLLAIALGTVLFFVLRETPADAAAPAPAPPAAATEPGPPVTSAVVEAACGQCQFGLEGGGNSCDLAVRRDGRAWFVDGTSIDEHGDAHAADGFCNAIRQARVSGHVEGERFVASAFALLPPADG